MLNTFTADFVHCYNIYWEMLDIKLQQC